MSEVLKKLIKGYWHIAVIHSRWRAVQASTSSSTFQRAREGDGDSELRGSRLARVGEGVWRALARLTPSSLNGLVRKQLIEWLNRTDSKYNGFYIIQCYMMVSLKSNKTKPLG